MADVPDDLTLDAALEAERAFVLTLGGFALELPGAVLVTHEKIPVPRFNFAVVRAVGRERQAAFFEHALDHYFQRALRPSFRVPIPVPAHLDAGLRRFGFRARPDPLTVLRATAGGSDGRPEPVRVRAAATDELDLVASFWTGERERPEFRTALEIAWAHPNPDERMAPLLASLNGEPIAAAIVYRHRSTAGIHAVATRPTARGRGAATALVRHAIRTEPAGAAARYTMFADSPRLEARLASLGLAPVGAFRAYELPADAELALPPPGPPGPPRWRPPRDQVR
ncbi:MAG TPA: GNAT family N-acetyltransferase [Thermoplasmata archaeon]|nr:GNAT family N-acetyltransferase [Thermoplasmata archaeon]